MQSLELYEQKVLSDPEFPVQVFVNRGDKRNGILLLTGMNMWSFIMY